MDIATAVKEAFEAAKKASDEYFKKHGEMMGACGFAWVDIGPGTHKVCRYLREHHGADRNIGRPGIHVYNPGGHATQNIDIKEAGAKAFAATLKKHFPELKCWPNSRLD
jgi:hypothetical protein